MDDKSYKLRNELMVMSSVVFEVVSKFGKKVILSHGRYDHITKRHPEVLGEMDKMKETLASPKMIRRSKYDEKVWLFYRFFKETPVTEKYSMAAVRVLNDDALVVTSYFTDRIKIGEEIWKEK